MHDVWMQDDLAEYLSAGADMILSKPLRARSLELLLNFASSDGVPVVSRPNCKLVEVNNQMQWTTVRSSTACNGNSFDTMII